MPGAHSEAERAPVEQYDPAGHSVQSLAAPRPVELEYVPSLHGKAAEAPSAQYDPAVHVTQAVLLESAWYVPLLHFSGAVERTKQ